MRGSAACVRAMRSGICSSGERAECGRRRGGDCVSRGAPRCPGACLVPRGGRSGRAGPGRVDKMSRQGGRGTESKKMVTAGPARRAHGVGHPGNRARGGGDRARPAAPGAAGPRSNQQHRALPLYGRFAPKTLPWSASLPLSSSFRVISPAESGTERWSPKLQS